MALIDIFGIKQATPEQFEEAKKSGIKVHFCDPSSNSWREGARIKSDSILKDTIVFEDSDSGFSVITIPYNYSKFHYASFRPPLQDWEKAAKEKALAERVEKGEVELANRDGHAIQIDGKIEWIFEKNCTGLCDWRPPCCIYFDVEKTIKPFPYGEYQLPIKRAPLGENITYRPTRKFKIEHTVDYTPVETPKPKSTGFSVDMSEMISEAMEDTLESE